MFGPPPMPPSSSSVPPVQVVQGRSFQFAIPAGWRVVEEGAFAVVLSAPDNAAVTVMVGHCGLPMGCDPAAFAYEKVSALAVQRLSFGPPRPGAPMAGFAGAYEYDCAYWATGVACRGVASVSGRQGYDSMDLALAFAASDERQWPAYAGWLPQVARHVMATDGAAFGARGIAQQNLSNSMAFGQQLQAHREHSQALQQELTDQRWRSDEMRQAGRGEALTAHAWFADPYGNPPRQMPTTAGCHWASRDGRVVSSADPTFDPRTATDPDWQRMGRQ